jgi:hypothetical protein
MGGDAASVFGQLVAEVRRRAGTPDPTGVLRAAVAVSAEHAALADRLLDRFVRDAREAGMSWTDIGAELGVSKQAARQRFAALPGAVRPAPRLQACLDAAGREARTAGAHEIDTHHLLAGLLAEGVAAAILERLDVSADAIRSASRRLFGEASSHNADPALSTEAACALETAAHTAATNAVDEVRTEHLLAALALDPGSRARRVLNDLGVDLAAIKRELHCYLSVKQTRPARWWKRRAPHGEAGCSFCGRPESTAALVRGPGVAVCTSCVALANDILEKRANVLQ